MIMSNNDILEAFCKLAERLQVFLSCFTGIGMIQEMLTPAAIIAQELNINVSQAETAIRLLDDGATVPFYCTLS